MSSAVPKEVLSSFAFNTEAPQSDLVQNKPRMKVNEAYLDLGQDALLFQGLLHERLELAHLFLVGIGGRRPAAWRLHVCVLIVVTHHLCSVRLRLRHGATAASRFHPSVRDHIR